MFKHLSLSTGLTTLLLLTIPGTALAREEFAADTLGLCELHNLSGYSAIDADGNLINLTQYCQDIQYLPEHEFQQHRFWQTFTQAADTEAVAFAESFGPEPVIDYGTTICTFLKNGGTLDDLRTLQADRDLPPSFEVAVTIAAITTYCPAHRADIGR